MHIHVISTLLVEPATQAHLHNACYQPIEQDLQPRSKVLRHRLEEAAELYGIVRCSLDCDTSSSIP